MDVARSEEEWSSPITSCDRKDVYDSPAVPSAQPLAWGEQYPVGEEYAGSNR
jgi:hypothetical protein